VAVAAAAAAGAAATGLLCFRPPPAQAQKSGGSRIRTAAATAGSASAAVAAASGGAKISSAAAAAAGKAQPNALGILGLSEEGDGGIGVLPLSPLHQQLAVNLMAVLDQNHDGKLTFREVLKLTEMTEPHWSDGRRLAKGERLLDQMDADRDGFVSKQEFLRYIERQYETFDERRHLFSVMVALDQLHQFVNGTRDDRNATTIVQQLEIGHISSLVNAVVDLPFFNEDQEQEIFEDAVVQVLQILDSALPHPYKQLIVSEGHDCSLPGLPEDEAEPLKLRLENHIERSLSLVCMEEPIERMLRTAVVEIVVEAMKTGNSLKDVTNAYRSGQLIMNIFIRGSVAMLRIGSSQRGQVVDTVTSNITLPFLPAFITQHCVEFLLGRVEVIVETGINNVFNRHFNAAKQQMQHCQQLEQVAAAAAAGGSAGGSADAGGSGGEGSGYDRSRAAEFHSEVKAELCGLLLPHVDHVPLPAALKTRWCTSFVEHTILAIIDVDRLTDAVLYIVSKHQEQEEQEQLLKQQQAAASSSKQQQAAASSSKQQQAAASSSKQQQAAAAASAAIGGAAR
jgi:hypothetical protein